MSQQPQLALWASLKPFLSLCSKTLQGAFRGRNNKKTFTSSIDWIARGYSHPRDLGLVSSQAQLLRSSAALAVQTQDFPCHACPARLTQPWPQCLSRLFKMLAGCDTSSGASLEKVLGIEEKVCHDILALLARLRDLSQERNDLDSLQSQSVYSINQQVFIRLPGGETQNWLP